MRKADLPLPEGDFSKIFAQQVLSPEEAAWLEKVLA